MPRHRPTSGYARLAQADEDEPLGDEESDDETYNNTPLTTRYASIQPGPREGMRGAYNDHPRRPTRRMRSNSSGVDIKAINARLERWAEEIASKFKIHSVKGKTQEEEHLEIHHSVFQAPPGVHPYTAEELATYTAAETQRMTKQQFEEIVESVSVAIENGMHPKMITQGSSGSYFARNMEGKVVGVFKPKDEEPYASRNPKWTKWLHRNLFPFAFGRACLIPNLSYVSEAAAYTLDVQLRAYLVPYTDVVWLSSRSFFYDFWERRNARKKGLPAKPGSFQVFLKGFKDANIFLRENPWPDQATEFRADMENKKKRRPLANCMPSVGQSDDEEPVRIQSPLPQEQAPKFSWTPTIKQAFREELEKLVILDYIMRNTDRGLDNWMIKIDWKHEEVSIVVEPPKMSGFSEGVDAALRQASLSPRPESNTSRPYRRPEAMESRSATPLLGGKEDAQCAISIGAIDNSLSWPWKHPDAWRSFPFGWLFLPVSLIGQPFSKKTREHFLPLLTSTAWWSETQLALRKVFALDADFKESMFARQIAVMKGQAWNVVETLKQADHGPLELTRRTRVCVWDDLVDVPVAVPMRVPSTEMSRKPRRYDQQEEMDIGASYASAPPGRQIPQHDLLGSPTSELPNPNRFDLTREDTAGDLSFLPGEEDPASPPPAVGTAYDSKDHHKEARNSLGNLPVVRPTMKNKNRFSFEFPRRDVNAARQGLRRQRSMSTRSGKQPPILYEGDDLEGDLGYAAASDMEANKRKVIVERLETIKGKKPFFTWC
ncbi:Phosphatidylinositol 4-kinase LSB6 [Elasticomyces elasticus]|uniref:Phosphatidylinositol 4-kinase n=1 Tax=Exophiala sideris TaxID=1016849 RepID=A0ABR0JRH1_9EURO|nr:Phosphatidylinositol 4-kinase LSB6 [Elasticomyces elasticus]KAK5040170.1 Phosphatidylinositol 4-kinase LSB6 [Exophiala sideris]KAK5043403.1 Phosphatidylinositol 4-kinase LSB6 [Exophiala sideris]KAK5068548.1 Phosphatidylinositol 4-kinase LSB6 [Exophiala sideris]KAK5186146.1 Phosphatidylinositol 4-kinase LSB6 [Eurotiomycetes sp. CCFEE 6388]